MRAFLGGKELRALVDAGAECSLISEEALVGVEHQNREPRFQWIQGVGGARLRVRKDVRANLSIGPRSLPLRVSMVSNLEEGLILGADALEALGIMGKLQEAVDALDMAHAAAAKGEDFRGESMETVMAHDLSHLDDVPEQRDRLRRILVKYRGVFLAEGRLPKAARVPMADLKTTGTPTVVPTRPWSIDTQRAIAGHEALLVGEGLSFWVDSSQWRSEPLLVFKPDGSTRYTGDFKRANVSLADEAYPMPNILQEAGRLIGPEQARVFSKFDLAHGFWQIPTTPGSWPASTLRGTKGLLQSSRLQMGHKAAPGIFNQRIREYLVGSLGEVTRGQTAQYLDDIATSSAGSSRKEAVRSEVDKVEDFLRVVQEKGFSLRLRKCKLAVASIEFCGLELSGEGKRIAQSRTEALLRFGTISKKREMRSFAGMVGQWRSEVPRMDLLLRPLYDSLRSPGVKLVMTDTLKAAVEAAKKACAEATAKAPFDPTKPAFLRVDGSRLGFGFALEQPSGRVVAVGSRQKSKAELNLSSFDTEWTAVVCGLEAFEYLTSGMSIPLTVISDCAGLEALETRLTEDRSGRRANLHERSLRFRFKVVHAPRADQKLPDALANSPAFVEGVERDREALVEEEAAMVSAAVATEALQRSDEWWRAEQLKHERLKMIIEFKEGTFEDEELSKTGWKRLAAEAADMDLQRGVLGKLMRPEKKKPLRSEWIWRPYVPAGRLRKDLFDQHHKSEAGHMRVDQTYERMRSSVFWPGMWDDCGKWCEECATCQQFAKVPGNWGPLHPRDSERLRGKTAVAVDIAGPFPKSVDGHTHFLLAVDLTDGWVEIAELSELTAQHVMEKLLRMVVASQGVPDVVLSDRASTFTAENAEALFKRLGVEKQTTAPRSPWANGAAEANIKIAKKIMKKLVAQDKVCWTRTLWMVLMAMRSRIPEGMRVSPFEARYGKKMVLPSSFAIPQWERRLDSVAEVGEGREKLLQLRDEEAEKMKHAFDKNLVTLDLEVGQLVWVRNEEVTSENPAERIGPFKVKRLVGEVDVEIMETSNGPKLGTRHPIQSVRNLAHYKGPAPEKEVEWEVVDVIDHAGHGRGRKYRVKWLDGSLTWEPRRSLVDIENGKEILLAPFKAYLDRQQRLGKEKA